jgi:hypothetical protein
LVTTIPASAGVSGGTGVFRACGAAAWGREMSVAAQRADTISTRADLLNKLDPPARFPIRQMVTVRPADIDGNLAEKTRKKAPKRLS